MLDTVDTPALVLDVGRLETNAAKMRQHIAAQGLSLRPHMKTAKSVDVANVALGGQQGPVTVSTLREAEYFAKAGFRDILYAVAIAPSKLDRVKRIQQETGAGVLLCTDCVESANAIVAASGTGKSALRCLIEMDCGEHRSGVQPTSAQLSEIAWVLGSGDGVLQGVMTHAGHSYGVSDATAVARIAEVERKAAVESAEYLRKDGYPCPIVSVGSTPTALHAETLEGVTEVRCGIYMFWDLSQYSRGMCGLDDIAVSVLATVIGHNPAAGTLVIDAGALALSKDLGANAFMPGVQYGLVCDVDTLEPIEGMSVVTLHQEHGTVSVPDGSLFTRLPIGSRVRVLPNHACLTCAAYDRFDLIGHAATPQHDPQPGQQWSRINGW